MKKLNEQAATIIALGRLAERFEMSTFQNIISRDESLRHRAGQLCDLVNASIIKCVADERLIVLLVQYSFCSSYEVDFADCQSTATVTLHLDGYHACHVKDHQKVQPVSEQYA